MEKVYGRLTQSVKWNREKVVEYNDLAVKAEKDYYDQINIADKEFADMVKKEIQSELDVSDRVDSILYDKAYEDGHANGYHEALWYAQWDYEFVKQLLNAMKEV